MSKSIINIGWLYHNLMNTYGDRGNIIALLYRLKKRGLKSKLIKISVNDSYQLLKNLDFVFMGGAQDKQQEIVNKDLFKKKGEVLKELIYQGIPGLYVCGAYQFLGNYYKAADGTVIDGLKIFDIYTENPGFNYPRLIGDIIIKPYFLSNKIVVGFENHGGRTYLGKDLQSFAQVIKGFGNNGQDKTEGVIFKNSIGTYLHGPILPKNPELTDWFIKKILEKKYKKKIKLKKIDNKYELLAKKQILKKCLFFKII